MMALDHGIMQISSSTTANSGVRVYASDITAMLLQTNYNDEFVIKFRPITFTATTTRFGFHDGTTSAVPLDGVYGEISSAGALTLITAANNVRSSSSAYTLTAGNWYIAKITTGTTSTMDVYSEAGVLLTSLTIGATNFPSGAGRHCGISLVTTNSGTTATAILMVDFIGYRLDSTNRTTGGRNIL